MLKAETIHIRPITRQDVSLTYLSWLNDDGVTSGLATSNYTLDQLQTYVAGKIEDKNCHFFAICDNVTGEHIGNIKLDFYDVKANVYELGILVGNKNYWGKGVGTQACSLVLDFAFNQLNSRKVWLAVYENNPGAKKLYDKLGFVTEGCLRKHIAVNGQYFDKYLMGIFKSEWVK